MSCRRDNVRLLNERPEDEGPVLDLVGDGSLGFQLPQERLDRAVGDRLGPGQRLSDLPGGRSPVLPEKLHDLPLDLPEPGGREAHHPLLSPGDATTSINLPR